MPSSSTVNLLSRRSGPVDRDDQRRCPGTVVNRGGESEPVVALGHRRPRDRERRGGESIDGEPARHWCRRDPSRGDVPVMACRRSADHPQNIDGPRTYRGDRDGRP